LTAVAAEDAAQNLTLNFTKRTFFNGFMFHMSPSFIIRIVVRSRRLPKFCHILPLLAPTFFPPQLLSPFFSRARCFHFQQGFLFRFFPPSHDSRLHKTLRYWLPFGTPSPNLFFFRLWDIDVFKRLWRGVVPGLLKVIVLPPPPPDFRYPSPLLRDTAILFRQALPQMP